MGEQTKRYRVTYTGKGSRQYVTLLARNPDEARQLAESSQTRRHERFPLTFARIEETLSGTAKTAELERRKKDQGRYDDEELKVTKVEEVK